MVLNEIVDALRGNAQLISEVWVLVKTNKLPKTAGSKSVSDTHKYDLPRSVNKFDILSKERLENAIESLCPSLDKDTLKEMTKSSLCRWLCWAIHVEEDSAVPSKLWPELLTEIKKLYKLCGGQRLESFPMTCSAGGTLEPDYPARGCFVLISQAHPKGWYTHIAHWAGIMVALPTPLSLDHCIVDNYHEQKAKITCMRSIFESPCMRFLSTVKASFTVPDRLRLTAVAEKRDLCEILRKRMPLQKGVEGMPFRHMLGLCNEPQHADTGEGAQSSAFLPPPGFGGTRSA